MAISVPRFFDESNANAWRLASLMALLLAVYGLNLSPEFSLINIGISLIAVVVSMLISVGRPFSLPSGALSAWIVLLTGVWLSPLASLPSNLQRLVFAVGCVFIGLVFQGRLVTYFSILGFSLGLLLQGFGADLERQSLAQILRDESFWIMQASLGLSVSLVFVRIAHARGREFLKTLKSESEKLDRTRGQVSILLDSMGATREKLLGRSYLEAEVPIAVSLGDGLQESTQIAGGFAAFDELVSALRSLLSDFQVRGRDSGRISGPIRFVFFQPAAGYDEKSLIAVDLPAVLGGVETCLNLALESLPEIGARRREGVIRLSIRYGVRVIEIAVEDNGRGLAARNAELESRLSSLQDLMLGWGGKFDRFARLGVGSRTSLELRIVREKSRLYRATLRHEPPVEIQFEAAPRG